MADVIVTQEDREAAADVLDEISALLDHVGIGQVADLIRDGEYDEHDVMPYFSAFRQQAMIEGARVALEAAGRLEPRGRRWISRIGIEALDPADIIRRHLEGEG